MVRLRDLISDAFANQDYGNRSTTLQGERVKSRAEQRIADYFSTQGIRYQYEKTLKTFPVIGAKISRPDFFLPDYNVYVEYWGMVDVPDKRKRGEYIRAMKWKMAQYNSHNIKCISLYPSNLKNLDYIFRTKFRDVFGSDLPSVQRTATNFCPCCGTKVNHEANFCQGCGASLRP